MRVNSTTGVEEHKSMKRVREEPIWSENEDDHEEEPKRSCAEADFEDDPEIEDEELADEEEEEDEDEEDVEPLPTIVDLCSIPGFSLSKDDLMRFETTQGLKLRILFETLSNMLVEGHLVFSPDRVLIEEANLCSCFVRVELPRDNIEPYFCQREYVIGVSFTHLLSCIRSVGKGDILVFRLTETSMRDAPQLVIQQITPDHSMFEYRVHLIDINRKEYCIQEKQTALQLSIPSTKFKQVLNSCAAHGKKLQILAGKKHIYFRTHGGDTTHLTFSMPIEGVHPQEPMDKQDVYQLSILAHISKAAMMGHSVRLHLDDDYPLLVICSIGTLGTLRVWIAPCIVLETDTDVDPVHLADLEPFKKEEDLTSA